MCVRVCVTGNVAQNSSRSHIADVIHRHCMKWALPVCPRAVAIFARYIPVADSVLYV